MIVKVLSRSSASSFSGLVGYILREETTQEQEQPIIFTKNLRGKDKDSWIYEFKTNESFRQKFRKDNVQMFHTILSASTTEDKSKITKEHLQQIFEKYTELWGKEGVHLCKVHFDKSHIHLHIASSALEYRTGKSMRMSHADLFRLKTQLQEFQKDRNLLTDSLVKHGKGKEYINDKLYFSKKTNEERTLMQTKMQELYKQATSQSHYIDLLSEQNIFTYERGNRPYGIMIGEKRHRFQSLDIPFKDLPIDKQVETQEQIVLQEIQTIRNNRQNMDRSLGRSI